MRAEGFIAGGARAGSAGRCRARPLSWSLLCSALLVLLLVGPARAFRVGGIPGAWLRWDAAPRNVGGVERSLAGGLRYSIEHGDYEALRDEFTWAPAPPSVEEFESAVTRAFENWMVVDPASGLPAGFFFVEDLATPAVDAPGDPANANSYLTVNPGAEIDLFAQTPHAGAAFAASVVVNVDPSFDELTLTSGTTGYPGLAIAGADIRINPAFTWKLEPFEVLLTHEIGHALGLSDLEFPSGLGGGSGFLDDDYQPATSAGALASLTNSFALGLDPADPDGSPLLSAFGGNMNADPGLDTPGVELLMETEGIFDLLGRRPYLQNDEFAARQFLYPAGVPEPSNRVAIAVGVVGLLWAAGSRARGRAGLHSRAG